MVDFKLLLKEKKEKMAQSKLEEEEIEDNTDFPDIWKPTIEGEEIKGEVVDIDETKYGVHLILEDKKTKERIQTPAHMLLQRKLTPILLGDVVRIVYAGVVVFPTGKKPANDYKVYRARPRP